MSKTMNRKAVSLITGFVLTISLAACGSKPAANSPGEAMSGDKASPAAGGAMSGENMSPSPAAGSAMSGENMSPSPAAGSAMQSPAPTTKP